MRKVAYQTQEYREIASLARPYYPYDGPNSWQHIQEVRRRAAKMAHRLWGRGLTPAEYAAVMLHDSTKREFGSKNHGRMGAERASKVLAAALSGNEVAEASQAISVHDDNLAKFPSRTAELLASADANPPDLDWFLNKAYCHNRPKFDSFEAAADEIATNGRAASVYGRGGTFNWPGIYRKYYGDKVIDRYRDALANLDPESVKRRLRAYHEKYGIDPDNPHVIHNR